jgi:hypothetical protein
MFDRKGMSSILGTLIFISILFSAVIPMFMMMRQADVYYEQAKLDANRLDEEKALEELKVYIAPTSDNYTLTVVNNGEVPATVIRVWENENNNSVTENILTQEENIFDPIDFSHEPGENETFEISIITERGNTFQNENGIMTYGQGQWMLEKFYIYIHAGGLFMRVVVTNEFDNVTYFDEGDTVGVGYQVEVPSDGTYHVVIEEKFLWWTTTVYDDYVTIDWPPDTSVDVYPD